MSRSMVGAYDHLNDDPNSQLKLPIDMNFLAAQVDNANYGTHRFLSALIRIRRQRCLQMGYGEDQLSKEIERLLNAGLY